jgi:hypothetical protein
MKINIPESLNEITIKQFFDFKKCCDTNQDDQYLRLAMVSIFCDISVEDIKKISSKDFIDISNQLTNVLKEQPVHVEKFIINGVEFGFIPNLENITAGEYIELDTLFKDEETFLEQMAVMYRPIIGKHKNLYRIEPFESTEKHKDIMIAAPISAYLGSKVFFCNLLSELLESFQIFLLSESQEVKVLEEVLAKNGVGINLFIQSLEEISTNLTKQLNSTYTHSLHI